MGKKKVDETASTDMGTDQEVRSSEVRSSEAGEKTPGTEKAAKTPKVASKMGYKFLRDINPATDKFNNQQTVLINAMVKLAKDNVVSREELLLEVTPEALKSRQTTASVLGFYMTKWRKGTTNEKNPEKSMLPLFESVSL